MKFLRFVVLAIMATGSYAFSPRSGRLHSTSTSRSTSTTNTGTCTGTELNYIVSSPSSYETHHAPPPHGGFHNIHAPPPHRGNPTGTGTATSPSSKLDQVLDLGISEESILKHYQEWCAKFGRRQDKFRFIVFQRNYLSQFKWNLAAGRQAFTLNEFADCTEEEYIQIMKTTKTHLVKHPGSAPVEAVVVEDEGDSARRMERERASEDFHVSLQAIDVEVLEHQNMQF